MLSCELRNLSADTELTSGGVNLDNRNYTLTGMDQVHVSDSSVFTSASKLKDRNDNLL